MNASTSYYASQHFTYSGYHASSYSTYDLNVPSYPRVREDSNDPAELWSYAITDEPSVYDRLSSAHQPELDSAQ